jgi:signal transduction histidine kinase
MRQGKFCLILICSLLFSILPVTKSLGIELSQEEIKTAYIYNFLKYIQWPNEGKSLKLVYVGDKEPYFQTLKSLEQQQVRGLSLDITQAHADAALLQADIILVDSQQESRLSHINALIGTAAILVIADNAKDKQLIGLNFVNRPNNKIGFEINRYNLIYQHLSVSKDIVLLGGSELDIATLVKEMESNLVDNRRQLTQLQALVQKKQQLLDSQQAQQIKQQELIKQLDIRINEQQAAKAKLSSEQRLLQQELRQSQKILNLHQSELQQKQQELQIKADEILTLSASIAVNQTRIEQQRDTLAGYQQELELKERELKMQTAAIEEHTSTIETQETALYISVALLISISVSIMLIYRAAQIHNRMNRVLNEKNTELKIINEELISTQNMLIEKEKMAALGSLVAGVAHEINTPIGIGITSSSHMQEAIKLFSDSYHQDAISQEDLEHFLEDMSQSTDLQFRSLERAAKLVRSFKQVSVDQSAEAVRTIRLKEYLGEISNNFQHQLKPHRHSIEITGSDRLSCNCEPGALFQIISNLVMNSIEHGFVVMEQGLISMEIQQETQTICIDYRDNGRGITKEHQAKVFDPFFTTNRQGGNSGLGMLIVYNMVTQKLKGSIQCVDSDRGAHFRIKFPVDTQGSDDPLHPS